MTPLADRSTGEQWPELERCVCGGKISLGHFKVTDSYVVFCWQDEKRGVRSCMRSLEAPSMAEAAAAWNAMQRVAGAFLDGPDDDIDEDDDAVLREKP